MFNEIHQFKVVRKDVRATAKDFLAGKEINQKSYTAQSQGGATSFLVWFKVWFNNFLLKAQQLQTEWYKALENAQLGNILLPSTLSDSNKITDARRRLKKFSQFIDNYERSYEDTLSESFSEISRAISGIENSLDLKGNFKKVAIDSFIKEKKQADQHLKKFLMVERSLIAEMDNLLFFLNLRHSKYWFEGNQIFFKTESDATLYNNHIQKIVHLATEESRLLDKQQDRMLFQADNILKELE